METIHQVIASLYAGVLHQRVDQFQKFAFEMLRTIIPYDSALWGAGHLNVQQVHSLCVVNQRIEDILTINAKYQGDDKIRARALASPGVPVRIEDTMSMVAYRKLPLYTDIGCRMGIEQAVGTILVDPINQLDNFFVLWRADRQRSFTVSECRIKAVLVPHIAEAWRQCQINALLNPGSQIMKLSNAFLFGRAIADSRGTISVADPSFGVALNSAFAGWHGPELPFEVKAFIWGDAHRLSLGNLQFEIVRGAQYHVISIAGASKHTRLTPAEVDVARRVAGGESHAQIAAARMVNRVTVRNQIARIYSKLGVHSKVELAAALGTILN